MSRRAAPIRRAGLVMACGCALVAGCRGKGTSTPRRDAGDAGTAAAGVDAGGEAGVVGTGVHPDGAGPGYTLATVDADGAVVGGATVTIKVQWPTAPASVRASPGVTACHTPRRPRAQVHTLHGVAGAMVVLDDVTVGKAPPAAGEVRVTLRDCAAEPAAATATRLGGTLAIQTQDAAHDATVEWIGQPWLEDDIKVAPVTLATAHLPVLGHTVAVALERAGAVRVVADGAAEDAAWVLAPPHPYAGVTDEVGQLVLHQVPPGTHRVVAWLPPRAGQPALRAFAEVTVAAGAAAEATVTFAAPPAAPP